VSVTKLSSIVRFKVFVTQLSSIMRSEVSREPSCQQSLDLKCVTQCMIVFISIRISATGASIIPVTRSFTEGRLHWNTEYTCCSLATWVAEGIMASYLLVCSPWGRITTYNRPAVPCLIFCLHDSCFRDISVERTVLAHIGNGIRMEENMSCLTEFPRTKNLKYVSELEYVLSR